MARQTTDISTSRGVRYQCDSCDRITDLPYFPSNFGGTDGHARAIGWRLTSAQPDALVYCPECTGNDEDYWDRMTLGVAHMAGIDAGNPAVA
jgi:hypothetical protein